MFSLDEADHDDERAGERKRERKNQIKKEENSVHFPIK